MIHFPSNFDPTKKYPVLVPVYGGPASASNTARETFVSAEPAHRVRVPRRSISIRAATPGMGKRQLDAIYLKLGQVEIDDMAEGVKALWGRPYFDKNRVGIFGTSYGGYASVMPLLRHPDVFQAGVRLVAGDGLASLRHASTPSATCGSRRRTRKATTREAR